MLEHLPTLRSGAAPSRSDGTCWAFGFVMVGGRAIPRRLFLTLAWALGTDFAETDCSALTCCHPPFLPSIREPLGPKPPARDRFPSFPQREAVSSHKNRVSVMVAIGCLRPGCGFGGGSGTNKARLQVQVRGGGSIVPSYPLSPLSHGHSLIGGISSHSLPCAFIPTSSQQTWQGFPA